MGTLRKKSFMIFLDANAPTEVKTPNLHEIAEIKAKHNEAKVENIESLVKGWGQKHEERVREVVRIVQEAGTDVTALKKYISTTFPSTNEMRWRDFAWAVHEIVISEATLPDNRHVPSRTSESTVRFRPDGYLGVQVQSDGTSWNEEKKNYVLDGSSNPTVWVKVVDGWAKDGNWGGYLQITSSNEKDNYIDSQKGWVKPVASKQDPVTFYDMGNYYEIWQKDRESGLPLTVQEGCLRFSDGATPAKWNLQDSTWD